MHNLHNLHGASKFHLHHIPPPDRMHHLLLMSHMMDLYLIADCQSELLLVGIQLHIKLPANCCKLLSVLSHDFLLIDFVIGYRFCCLHLL